jgi:signal transduction histidine kinase
MRLQLSKIVSSPFLISLAVYIAAAGLLPPIFQKYRLDLVLANHSPYKTILYSDLNSDGISETIIIDTYNGNNAFVYADDAGYVMEQTNIIRKIPKHNLSTFADYDNNGFREHYFFTISEDSIFLNAIEYPNFSTLILKDRLISTIDKNLYGAYDFSTSSKIKAWDINRDGYKEIFFNITAGYSYHPRAMYAYDMKNDSLYAYDADGIHLFQEYFFDFNDGKGKQLLFSSFATDNHRNRKGVAHPDTSAWLLVCNKELQEAFEPIPIGKPGTYIQAVPVRRDNSDRFDLFVLQSGTKQKYYDLRAYLYSSDGKLLKSKTLSDLDGKFPILLNNPDNYNYVNIIDSKGAIHKYDNDLNPVATTNRIPVSETTENLKPTVFFADINHNGDNEIIISHNNVITVLDKSLKHQASLTLENKRAQYIYVMTNRDNENHISFTSENEIHYLIHYKEDKLYPYRFLIYAAAFLALFFFFVIIVQTRTRAIRAENKKLEALAAERTREIEIKKNQLDELNRQLQDSNKKLQQKNIRLIENQQFKQMVTAMIVHDLKVPLNTINKSVSNQQSRKAIDKMLLLIDNIIDIYKLDEKKITLNPIVVNVSSLTQKLLIHVEPVIVQKNISVHIDCIPDLCMEGDQHLVERVLLNLLSNATKYTPNNGYIRISAGPENADIKLSVSNSTAGNSSDAFAQKKEESLGIANSSGIGLQFCKLALEAHDRTLLVKHSAKSEISISFSLPAAICSKSKNNYTEKKVQVSLTDADKKFLKPHILKLQKLEPYEASEIDKIITEVSNTHNERIQEWLKRLQDAVYTINSEQYRKLLDV